MLEVITITYLFFPQIIFFLGWLKLFWAIYLTFLLGLLLIPSFQMSIKDHSLILNKSFVFRALITLLAAIAYTSLSGAGGWGFQLSDWIKHNAVLKDLIQHTWPVAWSQVPQEPRVGDYRLIYYLAYYLPSALIGKLISWQAANLALFLWTALGVWLSLLWFTKLSRARKSLTLILIVAYFILAGGLDSVGYWFVQNKISWDWGIPSIEYWTGLWHWSFQTDAVGLFLPHNILWPGGFAVHCFLMLIILPEYLVVH